MTILHVSDLHYNKTWYAWLAEFAPPHDLLVISGDLLDLNHPASHTRQVEWVSDWVRDFGRPLAICSGNHDLLWDAAHNVWWPARWLLDLAGPQTWVDGQTGEIEGISFFNCPATGVARGSPADVWIVHAPPEGSGVSWCQDGRGGGDPNLLYSVRKYRPRLVLCGHVHNPLSWIDHFEGGLYLNPGRDPAAAFPNHVVIDLGEGCVRREHGDGRRSSQNVLFGLVGLPEPRATPPLQPEEPEIGALLT